MARRKSDIAGAAIESSINQRTRPLMPLMMRDLLGNPKRKPFRGCVAGV